MRKYPLTCFVAGTLILTASGLVAIEKIKPGNQVIAANPDTLQKLDDEIIEIYLYNHLCVPVPYVLHMMRDNSFH